MATKTLIIQSNIYNLLKAQYTIQSSLLTFEEYILDLLGQEHAIENRLTTLDEKADYFKRVKPSYRHFLYLNHYEYVDIETDVEWLLDERTDHINQSLAHSLMTLTDVTYTTSKTLAVFAKLLNFCHVKPNHQTSIWSIMGIYGLANKYQSDLIDLEAVAFRKARRKNYMSFSGHILASLCLLILTAQIHSYKPQQITHLIGTNSLSNQTFSNIFCLAIALLLIKFMINKSHKLIHLFITGLLSLAGLIIYAVNAGISHMYLTHLYVASNTIAQISALAIILFNIGFLTQNVLKLVSMSQKPELVYTDSDHMVNIKAIELYALKPNTYENIVFDKANIDFKKGYLNFNYDNIILYN